MNKSQITDNTSSTTHKRVQRSSTLNRKYVHRPNSITVQTASTKSQASKAPSRVVSDIAVKPHAYQTVAKQRTAEKRQITKQPSAQELKEQAIQKALRSVATMESSQQTEQPTNNKKKIKKVRTKDSSRRLAMAFACAIVCVVALGFFVNMNMPDLSVRVAAMQTGIEASYPSYVPRDYSLSNIISENGKITMEFKGPGEASFTLTEEKSSWDSTALLNNFVKKNWQDNYSTTHEQGITIYINNSNAAWVNGGIVYNITSSGNDLTKKQIRNIVTSL